MVSREDILLVAGGVLGLVALSRLWIIIFGGLPRRPLLSRKNSRWFVEGLFCIFVINGLFLAAYIGVRPAPIVLSPESLRKVNL